MFTDGSSHGGPPQHPETKATRDLNRQKHRKQLTGTSDLGSSGIPVQPESRDQRLSTRTITGKIEIK